VPLPDVRPQRFLRITQVALVLVALNIVSGAAVRLSDSGLGCPDWPTCSREHLTPALSLHPVVEFGNRMVVVVLCVFALLTLVAALRRTPRRPDLVWLSAGLVGGVVAEAVVGAVVVYTKLNAYVVMCHFLLGIAILSDAVVLALRAGRAHGAHGSGADRSGAAPPRLVGRHELLLSRVMLGLLALAVAAGTATTGAGPHAGGVGAKRVPVPLADMARLHSGIVLVLVGLTLGLLVLLARNGAPESVLLRTRLLVAAMAAQGVIGYTQYFSHLPPLLVGVHVFGATVVWTAMLWFYDGLTRHRPETSPTPGATPTPGVVATTGATPTPDAVTPTPVTVSPARP
jgi:cytochrome c oxidase assembly protein subunit 15